VALQHASMVVYTCDLDLRYTWLTNAFPGLTVGEMAAAATTRYSPQIPRPT